MENNLSNSIIKKLNLQLAKDLLKREERYGCGGITNSVYVSSEIFCEKYCIFNKENLCSTGEAGMRKARKNRARIMVEKIVQLELF